MTVAKVWDGTQWVPVVGAQGPAGPQGAVGATGPAGPPTAYVGTDPPASPPYIVWIDTDEADPNWSPPTLVTVLPSSPYDGQEVYYRASTNGPVWHLRYSSAMNTLDGFGWEFLGGGPLGSERFADEAASMGANAWGTFNANDPITSLPLTGMYRAHHSCGMVPTNACAVGIGLIVGGTLPVTGQTGTMVTCAAGASASLTQLRSVTTGAPATIVRQGYLQSAATQNVTARMRRLEVYPVRLSA